LLNLIHPFLVGEEKTRNTLENLTASRPFRGHLEAALLPAMHITAHFYNLKKKVFYLNENTPVDPVGYSAGVVLFIKQSIFFF
jgi:hypothetical protein